jgi:hypothetical protein
MNTFKWSFAILWVVLMIICGLVWHRGPASPSTPETLVTGQVEKVEYIEHWGGNTCHVSIATDDRVFVALFYQEAAKPAHVLFAKGDRVRFSSRSVGKGAGPHKFKDMDEFEKLPENGGKP